MEKTITAEQWQRVKELFEQALERDADERTAFVREACAGNFELLRHVEQLLASDRDAGEFLARPVADLVPTQLKDVGFLAGGQQIGPYRIVEEISHGGMGAVYLAERVDGQYRQRIAIKLIKSGLGSDGVVRRFRTERQVLAALEHPNIARLLDGGTTDDGLPYLAMEYVEGSPVDIWCDTRKLSVPERLKLFGEICAAVEYAHGKQVIHRDIKPSNILVIADGTPKLLDFGIAKVLNPELREQTMESTIGAGPMTPEYASPEQVRGQPAGTRSDVYALGILLYRLLTGHHPYLVRGCNGVQVARSICEQEPVKPSKAIFLAGDATGQQESVCADRAASPASLRRWLAGDLDKIVLKALRKEPERRYAAAAELSDDLDRFLAGLPVRASKDSLQYRGAKFLHRNRRSAAVAAFTALLVIALVLGVGRLLRPGATGDGVIRSIAVLPLDNISGDQEQEYFADGVTDALNNHLSRIPEIRVISRTSVVSFKKARRTLPEIGRGLGVQGVVEGSVIRSGGSVRIAVRLLDAMKDQPVWSGSYEGRLRDVLTLQHQVAEAIAREIHVKVTLPHQPGSSRDRAVNLDAYDAYLKGRHQFANAFTKASAEKAIAHFQQALTLDPGYAPAYAGLADCYYGLANVYYPPNKVMPNAKSAALKALELDNTLGEAHASLALVLSVYDFDRPAAEKEFRRALELKPSDAQTHLWYSFHLAGMGRFDEAVAEAARAQQLDPASIAMNAYVGIPLFLARRYDELITRLRPIADAHPNYHQTHAFLALAYEQKGDWTRAITEMERAYELDKEPEALAQLGHIYAGAGRKADARRVLRQVLELARRRYISPYNIAVLYVGLGEREEAFRWLQQVEEDRSEWFAAVNVDPRLDEIRSDPRFAGILRSVGLMQ